MINTFMSEKSVKQWIKSHGGDMIRYSSNIHELPRLFNSWQNVQIYIWQTEDGIRSLYNKYTGLSSTKPSGSIHLLYDRAHEHIDLALSPTYAAQLLPNQSLCAECGQGYTSRTAHSCFRDLKCHFCKSLQCNSLSLSPDQLKLRAKCPKCNRSFPSTSKCIETHNCGQYFACEKCGDTFKLKKPRNSTEENDFEDDDDLYSGQELTKAEHAKICGTHFYCNDERAWFPKDIHHKCYVQKREFSKQVKTFFTYDFEAYVHSSDGNYDKLILDGKHIPNVVTVMNEALEITAQFQSIRPDRPNYSEDIIASLFAVFMTDKQYSNAHIYAHNSRGYDVQFFIEYALRNNLKIYHYIGTTPQRPFSVSITGLQGIKFRDSHSLIPIPLRAFDESFDLGGQSKGDFPHLFNRPTHYTYRGPIPDPKWFGIDNMCSSAASKLQKTLKEIRENLPTDPSTQEPIYDFFNEMMHYNEQDTRILMLGLQKFRSIFKHKLNCDVLAYTTLPSACKAINETLFMLPNTIGIIPTNRSRLLGFHKSRPIKLELSPIQQQITSIEEVAYMLYQSKTEPTLRHAENYGFFALHTGFGTQKLHPDAINFKTRTFVQYHGCAYHPHGCHIPTNLPNPETVQKESDQRDKDLQNVATQIGWNVRIVRSCNFLEIRRQISLFLMLRNRKSLHPQPRKQSHITKTLSNQTTRCCPRRKNRTINSLRTPRNSRTFRHIKSRHHILLPLSNICSKVPNRPP